jgi:hypothetical protein
VHYGPYPWETYAARYSGKHIIVVKQIFRNTQGVWGDVNDKEISLWRGLRRIL